MKYIALFIFLLTGNLLIAQNNIELSFGVSNQGQIDKLLEDFYFPAHPTAFQDDAHKGKDLRIKYNFSGSYVFGDSMEVRLRIGYATRTNHYEQRFPTNGWIIDDEQNVFEISPSFGFRENLGRFSFAIGLEIPIYFVGDLTEHIDYRQYADSVKMSYAAKSDIKMDGGIIVGLNSYLNIKTFFTEGIYLFSELNYGILYSKLGRKYENVSGETFPTPATNYAEFDKNYEKVYVSPIQVQLGFGYRF